MNKLLILSLIIGHWSLVIGVAQTPVVFTNAHFTGASQSSKLTLTPLPGNLVQRFNGVTVAGQPVTLTPTNGVSRTNLYAGDYAVSMQGISKSWTIRVHDTTNELNGADLTLDLPTYAYVLRALEAGSNITFTTNAGALVITAATNSGGEVTTAQLLTVSNQVDVSSNALQTALVANDTTTSNGVLTAAQFYADGLTNYTTLAAGSVTTGDLTVTNSLNIATQNVALLVVTNIQDSLGSTGSVGQVLTVMGSGGIAYSNAPAGDVSTAQLLTVSNQVAAKLDVTNGAAVTLSSTYLTGETNAPFRVLNSNGVAFVQVWTNGALVLSDPNLDDIDKDWWTVSSNGGWYLFGSSSGEMMRVSDLDEGMVFAPSYHIQANLVATTVLQTSAGAYFEMLNTTPSRVAILNGSQQLTNEPGTTLYDLIGTGAVTNGALTNTVWSKLSASTLDAPGSATLGSATVTGAVSAASFSGSGAGLTGIGVESHMSFLATDASATPTTALYTQPSGYNAVRIWTGDRPVNEVYLDVYARTNTSDTSDIIRLYRWQGRILSLTAGTSLYLGCTNSKPVWIAPMSVTAALPVPSGLTNYVTTDQAGPPYWVPSGAHITFPSNSMTFTITTNRTETPIFVSEFDGITWSPLRWYLTETNADLTVQCTFRKIAIATYGGDTLRIVAPLGSTVGGISTRMSLTRSSGGRQFYVNTSSNWLYAVTNCQSGDTILIADGSYTNDDPIIAGSFATNALLGFVGSEGVTIRSASGNRDAVILSGMIKLWNTGATRPDLWKDLTFDFIGGTNDWQRTDGPVICENVRWQNNSALDLVGFGEYATPMRADLLWCSLQNPGDDGWNADGTSNSVLRLVGCQGINATNAANSQIATTHNTMPMEIYGGYYAAAPANVLAAASDAAPMWVYFAQIAALTNAGGITSCSIFGSQVRGSPTTALSPNTNGYILFSELRRNVNPGVSAAWPVIAHNRIFAASYAAQPRYGNASWVGNIIYTSFAATIRVTDFITNSGPLQWIGNTLYGATTGWSETTTNMFGRYTNNATFSCTTALSVAAGMWAAGDYNTFDDAALDADYTDGANDLAATAALDARLIPTASGNCDTNGVSPGWIGDSDPYGLVWIHGPTLVPRGARARQITNGKIYPDAW